MYITLRGLELVGPELRKLVRHSLGQPSLLWLRDVLPELPPLEVAAIGVAHVGGLVAEAVGRARAVPIEGAPGHGHLRPRVHDAQGATGGVVVDRVRARARRTALESLELVTTADELHANC